MQTLSRRHWITARVAVPLLVMGGISGAISAISPASAAPVLDQHQDVQTYGWPVMPDNCNGQTFVAGIAGPLSKVSLPMALSSGNIDPGYSATVQLLAVDGAGAPDTTTVLATTTLAYADITSSTGSAVATWAWQDIAFATPANVVVGTKYAVTICLPAVGGTTAQLQIVEADAIYADGSDWFTSPAWSDSGAYYDLAFRTYVGADAPASPNKCRKVAKQVGEVNGVPVCEELVQANASWKVPYGVSNVDLVLVGGGGGGGGGGTDANGALLSGGGGAGGSVSLFEGVAVAYGTPVAVSVGAGGAYGVGPVDTATVLDGTDGGDGGATSFGSFSTPGGGGGKGAGYDETLTAWVSGDGGATPAGASGASVKNSAHAGGVAAADAVWDVNHWFTAAGGGAGADESGTAAAYGTLNAGYAESFGGKAGRGFIPFSATSLFPDIQWVSSLTGTLPDLYGASAPLNPPLPDWGFSVGAGGAASGVNDLTTFWSSCGLGSDLFGNATTQGQGSSIGSQLVGEKPSLGQCGNFQVPTWGSAGGGGVGYEGAFTGGSPLNNGASGIAGLAVIRYLAGPLGPCDGDSSSTTTIETMTQVRITDECVWTAPSGVTTYDLLVVGGGGGTGAAYIDASGGGGGGEVVLCRDVTETGTVRMKPGAGGLGSDVRADVVVVGPDGRDGETSTASDAQGNAVCEGRGGAGSRAAAGAEPGSTPSDILYPQGGEGGTSGNGNVGGTGGSGYAGWGAIRTYYLAAGGGAGNSETGTSPVCPAPNLESPASADCGSTAGGNGTAVSALSNSTGSLFDGVADVYGGGGGGGTTYDLTDGGAGGGGDGAKDDHDGGYTAPVPGTPGTGGGGGGALSVIWDSGEGPDARPSDGAAGGSGVIIIRYVTPTNTSTPTITTSQVSDETITYGSTVSDSVTVTNDGEADDPSGYITFYYCYDSATVPSTCDAEGGIAIDESVTVTANGDGSSSAQLSNWTPANGAGYYLFHAVYSGDDAHASSVDDGTNESFHVQKKKIRVTPTSDTITAGSSVSYPFNYSDDFVPPETSSVLNTAPSCGSSYTTSSAAGTYEITCSGGSADNYWFEFDTATLTVQTKKPTLVYTGLTFDVDGGSTTPLTATVSDGCGGTVAFAVYDINGVLVDTFTATVSSGTATYTARLPYGIYTVTATFLGSGQCEPASDDAAVSVVNPNDTSTSTTGGGYYRNKSFSPQRVNFGYTVQKVFSGKTLVGYKGQLLWLNGKAWRLKGTVDTDIRAFGSVTCPAKDSTGAALPLGSKCVTFRGSGILQKWDSVVGGWKTATQYGTSGKVTFTVTVYDGGQASVCKIVNKTKSCSSVDQADSFGIQIDPVASTVVPEMLPQSLQAAGNNGSVQVK